jgi:hypothetical protein
MTAANNSLVCGLLAGVILLSQSQAASDITLPAKRKDIVELSAKLAEPAALQPLPTDIINPFNPEAFGQPDADELRALAEAQAAAAAAAAAASRPTSSSELLEQIAERIMPSGTLILGDESFLIFGQKRLRVGDRLTVTFGERDYTLELVAIDRVTFTLRLNQEKITKRIKPGK